MTKNFQNSDVIWLDYVDSTNEEIKRMFKNVSSVLHPEGSAHVSYIEGTKKDEYEGVFQQTFEELRDIGSKFGLKAVDSGDWNHPRNLKMITLTF